MRKLNGRHASFEIGRDEHDQLVIEAVYDGEEAVGKIILSEGIWGINIMVDRGGQKRWIGSVDLFHLSPYEEDEKHAMFVIDDQFGGDALGYIRYFDNRTEVQIDTFAAEYTGQIDELVVYKNIPFEEE